MNRIYFKEQNLHLKNEILNISFCFLIDSGFSKKIIKEILTESAHNTPLSNGCRANVRAKRQPLKPGR